MKPTVYLVLVLAVFANGAVQAEEDKSASEDSRKRSEEAANTTKRRQGGTGPIKLESVFVGDKEQPAISYFIPWQGVGAPDNLQWNVEEKHDKALQAIDREIMLRSIQLYDQLQLETPGD